VGGIIGKLSFETDETLARPVVEQMLDGVHRTHEGGVVFMAPGIALGWSGTPTDHVSTIIGTNERHTVRAISHSSLSNAGRLRAELERNRHAFRGHTDGELIAHAYEEWGPRCVERLHGPFACAIWDEPNRRLVLARDHIGLRPLYFALLPGHGVVFATELRALFHDPGVGREWCPASIDAYLALGYVPAPLSAYRRVSKLEPAHLVIVEGRRLHVEQYWDLPVPTSGLMAETATLALDGCLRRAVRRHLKDPQVDGVLYSGGTGSSALLCATPAGDAKVVTVVGEQDEAEVTRSTAAARHLGHVANVEETAFDMPMLARQLASHCGEPIADPSAISQLATCVAARLHTSCSLSAHGAAVLWAGYSRHRVERLEAAMRFAAPLATLGAPLARSLQDSVKGARALSHLSLPAADAYAVKHAYGLWDDRHRRAIYTRGFAWDVRDANPFARHLELYTARDTSDGLDRALYVDARTCLPDNTLASVERAALAAGIDVRFPFLDRELVEFASAVPSALKQRGPVGMYALRRLLGRELPPALMPARRRPQARHLWLRGALASMVPAVLLSPRFDGRGIVSRPALRQLWGRAPGRPVRSLLSSVVPADARILVSRVHRRRCGRPAARIRHGQGGLICAASLASSPPTGFIPRIAGAPSGCAT
jgi:asparagine synthase (glutamine-hydrolysing)